MKTLSFQYEMLIVQWGGMLFLAFSFFPYIFIVMSPINEILVF